MRFALPAVAGLLGPGVSSAAPNHLRPGPDEDRRGRKLDKYTTPDEGGNGHRGDPVDIGGQTVYPDEHSLAPDGFVTIVLYVADAVGARVARELGQQAAEFPNSNFFAVNVPIAQAARALERLGLDRHIKHVGLDQYQGLFPGEDGGGRGQRRGRRLAESVPYGINMVLQDRGWWEAKEPPTGSSKVCVVDTGYDISHEDLPELNADTDGFNPQSSGTWHVDGHGHGTHCAGTIGAVGDNDEGVVGVIPNSLEGKFSFYVGKGLSDNGSGSTTAVMAAVQACVDNGSNVVSLSLGGGAPLDSVELQYYNHYKNDDVLFVAAAGNSGNSALSYPASYTSLMSVAAVDSNENKAGFSQYNAQVEIAAPGVSVHSTLPLINEYASWSGTSMATPHVAGVAALLRMYFPDCKAFQIRRAMISTSKDKGAAGCDTSYGHGLVQAKEAYDYLAANACDTEEPFKEPEGGCAEIPEDPCDSDADCDDGDPCTVDTCNSGDCTSVMDCSMCDGRVDGKVIITTDDYPSETSWDIKDDNGHEEASGAGYTSTGYEYITEVCLTPGSKGKLYDFTLHGCSFALTNKIAKTNPNGTVFTIEDSYGDGICCSYGSGSYGVEVGGEELCEGNGQFGSSDTCNFIAPTLPPVAPPPTTPPVAPPTAPPVTPPTAPPVAPPTSNPPPPALVVAHADAFTFTPQSACLGEGIGASGTSANQCAEACAALENCLGFEVLRDSVGGLTEGDCVLASGPTDCDAGSDPDVWYYVRNDGN